MDRCDSCGVELQVGDWPFCPHGQVIATNASRCAPMVMYTNPRTGKTQTPGVANDPRVHAVLSRQGYERREVRPGREYERWQRDERTRIAVERERQHREYEATVGAEKREKRGQLYQEMASMTPQGREFAQEALKRAEAKDDARRRQMQKPAEPINHAVEFDNSNQPNL